MKRFVENCRRHGVHALAYVQFATLYPEAMKQEIPNLDEWAQVGVDGQKLNYYDGNYFRWLPCVTCDAWVAYLEKVCSDGAEAALYVSGKTLRKVYKKVGLLQIK